MLKKAAAAALALILLCALSGCRSTLFDLTESAAQQTINAAPSQSSSGAENDFETIDTISIPYYPGDSLSPFTASTTVNRYIIGLLYDSLVRLEPDHSYVKVLAKEISTEDYVTWFITVPGNMSFPDGEPYDAFDVRYSFFRAMTRGSYYDEATSNVGNIVVLNDYTLRVTLLEPDRYFASLLTFPIIEYGSVEDPEGIGRYTLSADGRSLLSSTPDAPISTIELVEIEDLSMLLQETRIGVFDCVFVDDPSTGLSASIGGSEPVPRNNLVYLGMNSYLGFMNSTRFRRAVELSIDREAMVSEVFGGRGYAAYSVFNPNFYAMDGEYSRRADLQAANDLLDGLGYTQRDENDFRISGWYGLPITLDIAVNGESPAKVALAEAVKDGLSQIGIAAEIKQYSYSGYLAAVESGATELYIAEVKLMDNMDISSLVSPEGSANYGFAIGDDLHYQWLALRDGTGSFEAFNEAFYQLTPFVPLLYRQGSFVYSRSFYFDVTATENDIFYNILQWK